MTMEQCKTCIHAETRKCFYHGYPDEVIPYSCEYKIGVRARVGRVETQMQFTLHGKRAWDE